MDDTTTIDPRGGGAGAEADLETISTDDEPIGDAAFPARRGWLRRLDVVAIAVLTLIAVVLRFWTRSPMWLDEALTVNIARQPLGHIATALRHDGHPPLYYYLLHLWMSAFGESDRAIRALPGVFGLLSIPATWLVAKRLGGRSVAWCTAVFIAVSPFMVRYATENRMYSLIMLLVPLGWLCVDAALERSRPLALVGVAVCTSALLWSQYWALWLGVATFGILMARIIRDIRRGERARAGRAVRVVIALAIGAVTFLPWVPTMLYQQTHTGTPWASRAMPPTVLVTTVQSLGGPINATDETGGWIAALIIMIGLFGIGVGSGRIELDLRTRPRVRPMAWPAGLTIGIGVAAMFVSNTAFQPRYNAVWLPFAFVIGGFGLALIRGPILQRGALALVVLAAASGCYKNVTLARTQSGDIAAAIEHVGRPGDIVAVCPDQLGPSLTRALTPGFEVGSFPTFSDPHIVNWSDYVKRTHAATPAQFADNLLRRAGTTKRIFVVWSNSYITHRKLCTDLIVTLGAKRPDNRQMIEANPADYEKANLTGFWPAGSH
ncbi:MAG: glycosyltransferase family 39 protein [Actinobacteria bacterium]|nr:glycosyltransferase family 39 protein [Actinomycetota bacterium]